MVNDRQSLDLTTFAGTAGGVVEWRISDAPVPYPEAGAAMEARVAEIAAGHAPELVWLLEHPPLYTSGTSGKASDLLEPRFPMFATGRGGQITYHGPGQRVAYVMLDLKRRRPDRRGYVAGPGGRVNPAPAALHLGGGGRAGRARALGERAGQGCGLRGQDRRDRRAAQALGVVPRHIHQCGTGTFAFRRHRALWRRRPALRCHESCRSWPYPDHGGRRHRAAAGLRGGVRLHERWPAGSDSLSIVQVGSAADRSASRPRRKTSTATLYSRS